MNSNDIADAMNNISDEELQKVDELRSRKYAIFLNPRIITAVSTGLVLVAVVLLWIYNTTLYTEIGGISRKYDKKFDKSFSEIMIFYPWEDLTAFEKFATIEYNSVQYITYGLTVDESALEASLGSRTLKALDDRGKLDTIDSEIFTLKGVNKGNLLVARLEGEYYVYHRSDYNPPASLGNMLDDYSLSSYLNLSEYEKCSNFVVKGYYSLSDDSEIWNILSSCSDAPYVDVNGEEEWTFEGRTYYTFTANGRNLGIKNRTFTVTEDGFIYTNIFDYAYVFEIGKEKADEIISYAKNNSEKTEMETGTPKLIGRVVEMTDQYIVVDDSVRCKKAKDGIQFRVLRNNKLFEREVLYKHISPGDIVCITFEGDVEDNNTIYSALTIDTEMQILEE